MEKLTFKQYLDSKDQLLKAIENTPVSTAIYEVKKYCSLPLGEADDDKSLIGLRPKQTLVVEWHHISVENPTPNSIRVVGAKDIDENTIYDTEWSGSKLKKWLARHTSQGESNEF